jgi:hypothetical protein
MAYDGPGGQVCPGDHSVFGDSTINGDLSVGGSASITSSIDVAGLNLTGNAAVTGNAVITGNLALSGKAEVGTYLLLTPTATAPTPPAEGMIYMDTDHSLYYHNGTDWKALAIAT